MGVTAAETQVRPLHYGGALGAEFLPEWSHQDSHCVHGVESGRAIAFGQRKRFVQWHNQSRLKGSELVPQIPSRQTYPASVIFSSTGF